MKILRVLVVLMVGVAGRSSAQDTVAAYPWRVSYFPYPTVTPNDGLMGVAHVILFRQSRWDDRVSLHDGISLDAGYSTKDAWLARARGDFPRIAAGWRLQAIAQAEKTRDFLADRNSTVSARREALDVEVTRAVGGPALVAVRGMLAHLAVNDLRESHVQGRIALIVDLRDREYDTRSGSLLQAGVILGGVTDRFGAGADAFQPARSAYSGVYGIASGWHPLGSRTRIAARAAGRWLSKKADGALDPMRLVPGWENEFVVGGGPASNRSLPVGAGASVKVLLGTVEVRHDVFSFPLGVVALLAFVDATYAYCACDVTTVSSAGVLRPSSASSGWSVGPGGGIAIRLLRNAVLTATVGFAEGKARVYVSSGWAW